MLSFLKLTEEDCFGHAYVFHPCDVASPAQLHLKKDGLNAGYAGPLEDFFVRHVVLPFDAKDGAQAALVKLLQQPDQLSVENPGLCTVQESGGDNENGRRTHAQGSHLQRASRRKAQSW